MTADDKTRAAQMARIRALMAKTVANGCTEDEARAAAAAVDRLIEAYEIDLDELTLKEQEIVRVDIALNHHPVRWSVEKIAAFCDCKPWVSGEDLIFLGLELDTEVAEYLTLLFMRAIDRESANYVTLNADYALRDRSGQREMLHSFQVGMASRLGERLVELKSKRDFNVKSSGRDLVAVKAPLVDAAFATLGIKLTSGGAGRSVRDAGAYLAGRGAAEKVSINHGVAGSAGAAKGAIR